MTAAGYAAPRRPAPRRAPTPRPDPVRRAGARLRVVDTARVARRRRARRLTRLATALSVGTLLLLAAFQVFLTQAQFELDHYEEQTDRARLEYEQRRLEVAQLRSPERVVTIARERLGMVVPPEVTYLPVEHSDEAGQSAEPDASEQVVVPDGWSEVKPHLADHP